MNKILLVFSVAAAIVLLFWFSNRAQYQPGKLDAFAQCIKDSGATFYGAFWCPHCHNQKEMFGNSQRLLPYFECSTPDGQSQLGACTYKSVQSYPTWVFKDGSRLTGEIPLDTLAQKTGCTLPAKQ